MVKFDLDHQMITHYCSVEWLTTYSNLDECVPKLHSDDRKSTLGGYFYVGNNLVSWMSKKQNSISLSIAEAEYIVTGSCCTNSCG